MITLSREIKNSLKLALAVTIAYGISFALDWGNPYWAAFAIIFSFASTSTVGQSLGKAMQRLGGTILATIAGFFILSFFLDNKWLFISILSLYLFVFAYLYSSKSRPVLYKLTGFICIITCLNGSIYPTDFFHITILRIMQTGMGVCVGTFVNLLIWPEVSSKNLSKITLDLLKNYKEQYSENHSWITQNKEFNNEKKLHLKARTMLAQFSTELAASTIDTPELFISKSKWKYFEKTLQQLFDELEILRESRRSLENINIENIFINISNINAIICKRLDYLIERCSDEIPHSKLHTKILMVNRNELEKLAIHDRAIVELIRRRINNICQLCGNLIDSIILENKPDNQDNIARKFQLPTIDRERLIAATRVVITLWTAFIIWINFRIPGNTGFIIMSTSLSLAFLTSSRLSVTSFIRPAIFSCFTGAIIYIFILPHLTSFASLAAVIFSFTFIMSYIFRKKEQTMMRLLGLAFTFSVASISNPQQFNILNVINKSIMFGLIVLLLMIISSLPESMYPGNVVYRMLKRYWQSISKYFNELNNPTDNNKLITLIKRPHITFSVKEFPDRISGWIKAINRKRFPELTETDLEEIEDIIRAVSIHTLKTGETINKLDNLKLWQKINHEFILYRKKLIAVFLEFIDNNLDYSEEDYIEVRCYSQNINQKISNIITEHQKTGNSCESELENIYILLGHHNATLTAVQRYLTIRRDREISVLSEFRI